MTFEQRMAELGVDLSDVIAMIPTHNTADAIKACQEYYAEVIDRMETRLVNVTGERDYLFERASGAGVLDCEDCLYNGEDCNDRCYDGTGLEHGVWAGVPEDWRPDDD